MPFCSCNGVDLWYEEAGQGSPLVFIHGHTLTAALWDDQWPVLARRFRTVRLDLRGHGRSSAPGSGYSSADFAADILGLLDHLGIARACLVGLSLGGRVALQVALSAPQRVSALVLIDSALDGFAFSAEFRDTIRRLRESARRAGLRYALDNVWLPSPLFACAIADPALCARLRDMVFQFSGMEYLHDQPAPRPSLRQIDRLGEIQAPTLVVVGQDDGEDLQRIADALARGIAGAERAVIAGCGHLPPLEQPEALNALLLEFAGRRG